MNRKYIIKMISISLFCLIMMSMLSYGQKQEEYRIHLKSIDTTYFDMLQHAERYHTTNANLAIVQAVIKKDSSHLKFISNRNLLPQIKRKLCDTTQVVFQDSLKGVGKIHFKISIGKFDEAANQITLEKGKYCCELINGKYPYGGEYGMPYKEINNIEITINGTKKVIPKDVYNDLFDFYTCEGEDYFERKMELYSSLNGDYIYLYIHGGGEASAYFTKLIFDKEGKYITRIMANYRDLLETYSFREGFIGF